MSAFQLYFENVLMLKSHSRELDGAETLSNPEVRKKSVFVKTKLFWL